MSLVSCRALGVTALLFSLSSLPLCAQGDRALNLVPRIGVTVGPPQFTFGVEMPIADVADVTHLVFGPSLDVGWGDGRTTIRANANLGYSIPTDGLDTRVFPLIGIAAYYQSFDSVVSGETVVDPSTMSFGVNIGAGVQVGDLVVQGLIGLGAVADLAITVGYSWVL